MRRPSFAVRFVALALLAVLAAAPALPYTVYLKDGSSVQAKKKYRVEGDKAVITLVNGSESFVLLSAIDVARTERENQNDYGGTAVVIDSGKPRPAAAAPAPAPGKKRLA